MALTVGGNLNTNTDAVLTTVEINSTTSTLVSADRPDSSNPRIYFNASIDDPTDDVYFYIKLQAASVDNNKKGIIVVSNTNRAQFSKELTGVSMYQGEISIISGDGTFDVHITEF